MNGSTPRQYGSGSVTPERMRDGRTMWRARLPNSLGRKQVGELRATEDDARRALNAALASIVEDRCRPHGSTDLATYAAMVYDDREKRGKRNAGEDRKLFARYCATRPWASLPVVSFTDEMAQLWIDELAGEGLSKSTIKNALNSLRIVFRFAKKRKLLAANPLDAVEIDEEILDLRTADRWTYLTGDEIARLLAVELEDRPARAKHGRAFALGERWKAERWIVACAIALGLRQGEQWCLELSDVHLDDVDPHVTIRFGSPGLPPKNGKTRRVWLTAFAKHALSEWLKVLPSYAPKNDLRLVFPGPAGARRQKGKLPPTWKPALKAAGITRNVRWHDLRHTCASALLSGVWGTRWVLVDVSAMLGHSSVAVTERYAHLADSAVKTAVAKSGQQLADLANKNEAKCRATLGIRTPDLRFTNPSASPYDLAHLASAAGQIQDQITAYRAAVASRSPTHARLGLALAAAVEGLLLDLAPVAADEDTGT